MARLPAVAPDAPPLTRSQERRRSSLLHARRQLFPAWRRAAAGIWEQGAPVGEAQSPACPCLYPPCRKDMMSVDAGGSVEETLQVESQGLLAEFITYIQVRSRGRPTHPAPRPPTHPLLPPPPQPQPQRAASAAGGVSHSASPVPASRARADRASPSAVVPCAALRVCRRRRLLCWRTSPRTSGCGHRRRSCACRPWSRWAASRG